MMYIWPWHAPELPPQRLISSMITEASARLRPEPPYSSGIKAASQPASRQRVDELGRVPAGEIDLAEVFIRKLRAQRTHAGTDFLVLVGRSHS